MLGGKARPIRLQWIRDLIADCRDKGVAVFHKQWETTTKIRS
jgi:protein gp37